MNEEEQYFMQQAGTGIAVHQGFKHQKGYNFWGKLIKWVSPIVRFLGRTALSTGADIAEDVIVNDKDLKESVKERVAEAGKTIVKKGAEKARSYAQKGSGRKRKRKTKKMSSRKKPKRIKKRKIDNLF